MIRRSPCERFIQALILHPDGYTDGEIQEEVLSANLDWLGDLYLQRLRKKLKPPKPFFPDDPDHLPSVRFLNHHQLHSFFHPDEDMTIARELLDNGKSKEFIETMLLQMLDHSLISLGVKQRVGVQCSEAAVARFQHYFFDTTKIDRTHVQALVNMRSTVGTIMPDPFVQLQVPHLTRSFFDDPRRIAATLPQAPAAVWLAQMRMGIMPSKIDMYRLTEDTLKASLLRVRESVDLGGTHHEKARDWSIVARNLADIMENMASPQEDLLSELTAVTLETDGTEIPTIHELSGGNHTTDLAPEKIDDPAKLLQSGSK